MLYDDIPIEAGSNNLNTGNLSINVVDPKQMKNQSYKVTFQDMSSDEIDNDLNGLVDGDDILEKSKITTFYDVQTLNKAEVEFSSNDTLVSNLGFKNIITESFNLYDENQNLILPEFYRLDNVNGKIFGKYEGSLAKINIKQNLIIIQF